MSTNKNKPTTGGRDVVDLTLPLTDGMISYPSGAHQRFEASVMGRLAIEGRETRKVTLGSHAGTHIDAPRHFIPGAPGIDELSPDLLVGEAWLVDLGTLEPGTVISKTDIEPRMPRMPVQRLLVRAGWDRFWNTEQYYHDWPTLDAKTAKWLISIGIRLVGLDFPSPDPAYFGHDRKKDSPNHKLFFRHGVVLVEYLAGLERLPSGPIFLAALPLRLVGFDGSPARVVAFPLGSLPEASCTNG